MKGTYIHTYSRACGAAGGGQFSVLRICEASDIEPTTYITGMSRGEDVDHASGYEEEEEENEI